MRSPSAWRRSPRTDNITQLAGDPARAMVGYACAKAVNVALYDEEFGGDDPGGEFWR